MRRKGIIWTISILFLASLIGLGISALTNRENQQLYRAVQNHVREYGQSEITLGELVEFDWDQALFFDYTNPNAIYERIGVYFGGTDLTRGLLFINDGEIVYYEYFPQRAVWIDIQHIRLAMGCGARNLDIFGRDSVFSIRIGEDYFGNRIYWLIPLQ